MSSLKQRTVSAIIWNTIEKVLVKGSTFAIGIILARLLSPSDYGLLGMLGIFAALSGIFIESGFAKALIQKQDCSDVDYSTAFYTNFGVSIVVYLFLFLIAPYVALFYEEEILCPILRLSSVTLIIGSLNIVQRARLMAQMNFKALAQINFLCVVISGIFGICLAYCGFGVWSLVWQSIVSSVVAVILFPFYSKWHPIAAFSKQSFNHLFGYGSKLLVTGVVSTIVNNISTIAIGKTYKSGSLGFYTRATQFTEMIAWTVNDILGTVTFPVLSELQNDKEQLVSVYRKSLFYTALVIFPVMVLLALIARPLVIVMLTEKWLPCVVLMQILCFARMWTPLSAINMNLLNAIGRSDLFMKVDLTKIPLILITLAITIPISVKAIVIGSVVNTVICFFINTYYPGKLYGYGAYEQLKDYRGIFVALLLMAVSVLSIEYFFDNVYIQLFLGGVVGVAVYVAYCVLFKIVSIEEVRGLIKRK